MLPWFSTGEKSGLKSTDAGLTWSTPATVATGVGAGWLSMAVNGNTAYLAFDGFRLFRSTQRGDDPWVQSPVSMSVVYGGVGAVGDRVMVISDTPDFHLRVSTDAGVSFGPETNPVGALFYSTWDHIGSTFYGSGSQSLAYKVDTVTGVSTEYTGFSVVDSTRRQVSVDPASEALFLGSQTAGNVLLEYLAPGDVVRTSVVTVGPGTNPSVQALDDQNVAIVYTNGGALEFAIAAP